VTDKVNGMFEAVGAILLLLNCRRLYIDKETKGISFAPFAFYTAWGFWNLFFYPAVGAYWSMIGSIAVVAVNATFCGMVLYYKGYRVDRFIEILIALFLPPLAVALRKGLGVDLLINLLLCLLLWVPAIIHAVYVVCSDD
jgi:uncharacterized membrane protein YqaE (UPF0057 family)